MKWHKRPAVYTSRASSLSDIANTKDSTHKSSQAVVVQRHGGWLLLRYWIHIVAVLSTAGVAVLNLREIFLTDINDANAVAKLNAFQFVARVHEALLLGSVILSMMDIVRARLTSSNGVALGHLLSPFTFTNFDFLCSPQLWRSLQLRNGSEAISLMLLVAISFANVAGPLSAITVVPRPGLSRAADAAVFPHLYNALAYTFWPERLNTSSLPSACSESSASTKPGCPAIGLNQTGTKMDYKTSNGPLCLTQATSSSCNVSVASSSAANAISRILSVEFDLNSMTAFASTPNAAIYSTVSRKFEDGISFFASMSDLQFIQANKDQLVEAQYSNPAGFMKPAVAAECQELDYDNLMQLLGETKSDLNWTVPAVTWLDDVGTTRRPTFLFSYRVDSPEFEAVETCDGKECYTAVSCMVDARWSPHRLWYSTAQPGSLFQSDPQPRAIFEPDRADSIPVVLRKDWLDMLSIPSASMADIVADLINNWRVPRVRAPQSVPNAIQENIGPTNRSVAVAIILASTLTESLAQLPLDLGDSLYNGNCSDTKPGFTFPDGICAQSPSSWVHQREFQGQLDGTASMITFTVRRSGYGWFLLDSIVIKIALGILLFHAFVTSIYLVYILISRKTITSKWSSAAELMILAIDSFRAPELIGSTVQVSKSSVWQKRVTLREVDYGDRLSLIVGDPGLYPERVGDVPQLGKKYQ